MDDYEPASTFDDTPDYEFKNDINEFIDHYINSDNDNELSMRLISQVMTYYQRMREVYRTNYSDSDENDNSEDELDDSEDDNEDESS